MHTTAPQAAIALEQSVPLDFALDTLRDQTGRSLHAITEEGPTLVCLLRHNGCTFCRETLAALGRQQRAIRSAGLDIAVVGMSASAEALSDLGGRFGLRDVAWIADPDRVLYRALRLGRGTLWQLLGVHVMWSGLRALTRGYGIGRPEGDPFQMPGTVVIHRGRVLRQHIHSSAADRPDYAAIACEFKA